MKCGSRGRPAQRRNEEAKKLKWEGYGSWLETVMQEVGVEESPISLRFVAGLGCGESKEKAKALVTRPRKRGISRRSCSSKHLESNPHHRDPPSLALLLTHNVHRRAIGHAREDAVYQL